MHLPNFGRYPPLADLRARMGAVDDVDVTPVGWDELSTRGIDIHSMEQVEPTAAGALRFEGRTVVLYIRDQSGPDAAYRFHLAECGTLKRMRTVGLKERYVATDRADGLFAVQRARGEGHKPQSTMVRLRPCNNCLHVVDWDGWRSAVVERAAIFSAFELRDFFEVYTDWTRPAPFGGDLVALPALPVRWGVSADQPAAGLGAPPVLDAPWLATTADLNYRRALLVLERFGQLHERDLADMVGGARRARRFSLELESWKLPFGVMVRVLAGGKVWTRTTHR
jgi:hypothetical protein